MRGVRVVANETLFKDAAMPSAIPPPFVMPEPGDYQKLSDLPRRPAAEAAPLDCPCPTPPVQEPKRR